MATATIILPVITGLALPGTPNLGRLYLGDRNNSKPVLSRPTIIVILLLVVYDTIIGTLAMAYVAPPSSLNCHLERQWASLFSNKNADVIRRIQDRHLCCGFNSVRDRAWPFPGGSHTAEACYNAFGRERSCFGPWRQDEQVAGSLMLSVAVAAFILQVLF